MTEDVGWDISMEKWDGQGKDWAQRVTMHKPKKDDVIVALVKMTRQAHETSDEKGHRRTHSKTNGIGSYGSRRSKERRGDPNRKQGRQ